ncbi:hypothetical protein BBJ28_00015092 [Nothophytophthora sp. Chile5]|nr:hypothetical protein BBJ28_00015092 [Nothophytophthora sp. Chile5]
MSASNTGEAATDAKLGSFHHGAVVGVMVIVCLLLVVALAVLVLVRLRRRRALQRNTLGTPQPSELRVQLGTAYAKN